MKATEKQKVQERVAEAEVKKMKATEQQKRFEAETRSKLVRLERAKALLDAGKLFPIFGREKSFICFSQTQEARKEVYLVDLAETTCTCPDHNNGAPNGWCKHLVAAWLWLNHPNDYRDWLPGWAKPAGNGHDGVQKRELGKTLAELSDEALARLILLLTSEQQERDYRKKMAEPGA